MELERAEKSCQGNPTQAHMDQARASGRNPKIPDHFQNMGGNSVARMEADAIFTL